MNLPFFRTEKEKMFFVGRYQTTDDQITEIVSVRWSYLRSRNRYLKQSNKTSNFVEIISQQ